MKLIIAGAGEIGKALINRLVNEKNKVTLIEKDETLTENILATQIFL